ncbi:MAG: type II secretion system protein GspL [Salinisphaeraceae bacterium]
MSESQAILVDAHGQLYAAQGDGLVPAEPADLPADVSLILVVPGEDVLLSSVDIPPVRQATRRRQAVRFALEDRLAQPIDELHIAIGPRTPGGEFPAAIAAHDRMEAWLGAIGERAPQVVAIVPDYLCLSLPHEGEAALYLGDDRALVRIGPFRGFACELSLAPALLRRGDEDIPLHVATDGSDAADQIIARLRDRGFTVEPATTTAPAAGAAGLLHAASIRPPINLLQDIYAPRSASDEWLRPLRPGLIMLGLWIVLLLAGQALEYRELAREQEQMRAFAEAQFRAAFPDVNNLNNLRLQAENEIRQLRAREGTAGLFPLLQAAADAIGPTSALTIDSFQFRNGELFLSLRGDDVQSVEALRSGFADNRVAQLEIQSADAGSDGVQIRARVSPAAS